MSLLALISAAYLALAPATPSREEVFKNPTVGVELTKPQGWVFLSAERNQENLNSAQFSDEEIRQAVTRYASLPMVAITKYEEPFADLNPSIKINARPLGQLPKDDPKAIMALVLPSLQRVSADAKIVQPPIEQQLGGLKAAYARVDYTLKTADGGMFPTSSEIWIVPRGEILFIIGAGTRQDERTGSREEIRAILSTLNLSR